MKSNIDSGESDDNEVVHLKISTTQWPSANESLYILQYSSDPSSSRLRARAPYGNELIDWLNWRETPSPLKLVESVHWSLR